MASNINPIPTENVFEKRKDVVSKKKCADCNSLCCHDLVMEIDKPTSEDELSSLMWYLHFENSYIFIYDDCWYHMIRSQCRFLSKTTKLCTNYENRTDKCKSHTPPHCERYEEWYDEIFDDPYLLETYVSENDIIKHKVSSKKNGKKSNKKN